MINDIGSNIFKLRKAAGLTQLQVCDKIGVTQSTLASYEIGRRSVNSSLIIPLAKILNVTPNDIFGVSSEEKTPGPKPKILSLAEQALNLPKAKQKLACDMLEAALKSK